MHPSTSSSLTVLLAILVQLRLLVLRESRLNRPDWCLQYGLVHPSPTDRSTIGRRRDRVG